MSWNRTPKAGALLRIPVASIFPNPHQPRKVFAEESLRELADSIRQYGILQPLSVQKTRRGYELIAGERRLRAAKLAGLNEVPCLLVQSDEEGSSLLALVENLQRENLHYLDEAAAISHLAFQFHLSQEEIAGRLGKSQSAVANKLRLLKLSRDCTELLRSAELTERHARALLRLEDEELRLAALRHIIDKALNVAESESYIEALLQKQQLTEPRRRPTYIIKDVRLFLNSVSRNLRLIQQAGVNADWKREDTDEQILLTIRIPKGTAQLPS